MTTLQLASNTGTAADPSALARAAQSARVAVLASILSVPRLMPAVWGIAAQLEPSPNVLPGLTGRLPGGMPEWQAEVEVGFYVRAFGLEWESPRPIESSFVQVGARGVVDGVGVYVWAPAVPGLTVAVAA